MSKRRPPFDNIVDLRLFLLFLGDISLPFRDEPGIYVTLSPAFRSVTRYIIKRTCRLAGRTFSRNCFGVESIPAIGTLPLSHCVYLHALYLPSRSLYGPGCFMYCKNTCKECKGPGGPVMTDNLLKGVCRSFTGKSATHNKNACAAANAENMSDVWKKLVIEI
jgi:hypothetical protein